MKIVSVDIGIRNLAVCELESHGVVSVDTPPAFKIGVWRVIDLTAKNLNGAIENLIREMDEFFSSLEGVASVVCESQPARNITMKSISHALQAFCLTKGITFVFSSASNKLKVIEEAPISGHQTPAKAYKSRKETAVRHCRLLLPTEHLAVLDSVQKKDDLADAFLQGIAFLNIYWRRRDKRKKPGAIFVDA